MTISMYQASVPVFVRMLKNLNLILDKGNTHAEAKKIAPNVLPGLRLIADMFPLSKQVQIATDHAKGAVARLAEAFGMRVLLGQLPGRPARADRLRQQVEGGRASESGRGLPEADSGECGMARECS